MAPGAGPSAPPPDELEDEDEGGAPASGLGKLFDLNLSGALLIKRISTRCTQPAR
jgi:hypothetical protein